MRMFLLFIFYVFFCFFISGCGVPSESFGKLMAKARCDRVFRCCDQAERWLKGSNYKNIDVCLKQLEELWTDVAKENANRWNSLLASQLIQSVKNDPCSNVDKLKLHERAHMEALLTSSDYAASQHLELGAACGIKSKTFCRGQSSCLNEVCIEAILTCEPI